MKTHYSNSIYGTIATGRGFLLAVCSLALLLLAGCGGNPSASEEQLITVDVTKRYPTKEFLLQDLFDIEYVPLETTDEFVTKSWVMDISENIILTIINTSGDILLFDRKTGKGLAKFNHKGDGPDEYLFPYNVIIDEENRQLFVNDGRKATIRVYDMEGNPIRSFKNKDKATTTRIYNYDQEYLLCEDTYTRDSAVEDDPTNTYFLLSKHDGSFRDIHIPYAERRSTFLEKKVDDITYGASPTNSGIVPYSKGWLLMEPSADTVYALQEDFSLKPYLVRTPSVQGMDPVVFLFPSVQTDRYCFMQSVEQIWDFEKKTGLPSKDLVYDQQDGRVYECIFYNADFEDGDVSMPKEYFDQEIAFYVPLNPFDLIEANAAGKLSGRLAEIASTLHEEDNPVIMIAKYKK